jgi:hypothetical protein
VNDEAAFGPPFLFDATDLCTSELFVEPMLMGE